jgi:hypothetical protein
VPRASNKLALNLAQVADGAFNGGSFKTSFLIFNISLTTANVVLTLTKDDGSPFTVTIPGVGTNSTFNLVLGPGASVFLQTDGSGSLTAGAATITSDVPIGASAIFTVFNPQGGFQTEAGVGDSPVLTQLTLPVEIGDNIDTGVAFFNPGGSAIVLTANLLDENGNIAGAPVDITIEGNKHAAVFVSQLFPGTGNFRGSLGVTGVVSSEPGNCCQTLRVNAETTGIAALTLRQNASPLSYTTVPVVAGTATGTTPVAPLLSKTRTGIAATSDITVNEILPWGARLSGTIGGNGQGVLITAAGVNDLFMGWVNQQTGRYVIVLPTGTYNLRVCYTPAGVTTGVLTATYADPNPVQVAGDTNRDINLPLVAPLMNVSGTVAGLGALPNLTDAMVVFVSNDNMYSGEFTIAWDGSYQGVLPSGTYQVSITASLQFAPPFQTESLSLFNLGAVNVGGSAVTANFAIPALATLSGSVTGGGFLAAPLGTSVTAADTSAPVVVDFNCAFGNVSSTAGTDLTGQYLMILARNRSFDLNATVMLVQGTQAIGAITYPALPGTQIVNLAGDTNRNFVIPNLPGLVTVSGRVTDGNGQGVKDVAVFAYSESVTGAPNLGFSAGGVTDANGNYSFVVLSGLDYQVMFQPPWPTP